MSTYYMISNQVLNNHTVNDLWSHVVWIYNVSIYLYMDLSYAVYFDLHTNRVFYLNVSYHWTKLIGSLEHDTKVLIHLVIIYFVRICKLNF